VKVVTSLPRQPARDDELKFPSPFEEDGPTAKQVRGSLPILPSVGLGPNEPKEAQDPAWDPLKSKKDDHGLPDKPLTRRRRLVWPTFALVCGLLLLSAAFFLIDRSDDSNAAAPTPSIDATAGVQFAPPMASPTAD
jgi:hypothetical protein